MPAAVKRTGCRRPESDDAADGQSAGTVSVSVPTPGSTCDVGAHGVLAPEEHGDEEDHEQRRHGDERDGMMPKRSGALWRSFCFSVSVSGADMGALLACGPLRPFGWSHNLAHRATGFKSPDHVARSCRTARRTRMRDPAPQAIRLADHRPPARLVDEVSLSFRLAPRATRVTSRIAFRPDPDAGPRHPSPSTGRGCCSRWARIDGEPVEPEIGPHGLTCDVARPPLRVGVRGRDRARREHRARGALHVERHVLHPVRGRGVPAHHLLPRPPRRDGALPRAHRVRPAGAAVERRARGKRPRLGRVARPLAQALLPLRAGGGRPARASRPLRHHVGARGGPRDLDPPRPRRGALRLRHGRA